MSTALAPARDELDVADLEVFSQLVVCEMPGCGTFAAWSRRMRCCGRSAHQCQACRDAQNRAFQNRLRRGSHLHCEDCRHVFVGAVTWRDIIAEVRL